MSEGKFQRLLLISEQTGECNDKTGRGKLYIKYNIRSKNLIENLEDTVKGSSQEVEAGTKRLTIEDKSLRARQVTGVLGS